MSTAAGSRRLGLRATVLVSFCGGALLLSVVLAVGTYLVSRHYLVEQRERAALRQAFADASYVRDGLRTAGVQVSDVLGAVSPPADSTILVHRQGRWFSSSLDAGAEVVPAQMVAAAERGSVTTMWSRSAGGPAIAVGVPLAGDGTAFFEVSSTAELSRTLSTLRAVLTFFAVMTVLAGALLGRAAARRLLAPLDDVARAAARISVGEMSTRLPESDDRDLATIIGSFNTMVQALDERIRRDSRFAADLGHELRSPLTTLMTSVELLGSRRSQLPEPSQKALDLVTVELERFRRSLDDLLELGRLDAGVATLDRSVVSVVDLVVGVVEASRHGALTLDVQEDAAGLRVDVDKNQIGRALLNLLENADLHGGGVERVVVRGQGACAVIDVEDAGPGVAERDRQRIFERFYRAGSRGSRAGTGLGLSLVSEAVQAHGGAVTCSDRPGGGARFSMALPAHAPRTVS